MHVNFAVLHQAKVKAMRKLELDSEMHIAIAMHLEHAVLLIGQRVG